MPVPRQTPRRINFDQDVRYARIVENAATQHLFGLGFMPKLQHDEKRRRPVCSCQFAGCTKHLFVREQFFLATAAQNIPGPGTGSLHSVFRVWELRVLETGLSMAWPVIRSADSCESCRVKRRKRRGSFN